jgi:CDP-diacylglycerol--serine O-phosphatidyltransferase
MNQSNGKGSKSSFHPSQRVREMLKHPERVKKGIYLLPNLLTSASLFCGFYSIIAAINGNYTNAAIATIISGLFDGMDGKIARYTNTQSKFGVQYDSLSDLIAFGAAPALLIYLWGLSTWGRIGWLASFLYLACGALRLARFNVQTSDVPSTYFVGLATPAAAGMVVSTVLFMDWWEDLKGIERTHHDIFILLMVYAIALLMVSNIRYFSLKKIDLRSRRSFHTLVLFVFILCAIMIKPQVMLFVIGIIYTASGPVAAIRGFLKQRRGLPLSPDEEIEYSDVDEDILDDEEHPEKEADTNPIVSPHGEDNPPEATK